MPRNRLLLALPTALLLGVALSAAPAGAATLTVTTTVDGADNNPGNGICASTGNVCTLRAAVGEAGSLAGADTIVLPAGNYQLGAGLGTLSITSSVTINGAGARTTTIRAAAGTRPVQLSATATLRDLTVTGGNVAGSGTIFGGGIRVTSGDLTLERVAVQGNQISSSQAAYGGGISVEVDTASLTLIDSTVTANATTGQFGVDNQGAVSGGGIYTGGPAIIKRSTIAANSALGGAVNYAVGGGASINGLATIEQSTFAGNTVATIADSSGFRQGGNLALNENATISGTVFTGGTATSGPDCYLASGNTVTEPARNLESQTTPQPGHECLGQGSLRGVDPKLAPLADNGGPTDTMRPAAGSPAIDAAANCGSRTTDQRGNTLFGGAGCDLGAVEIAASRTVQLQASKAAAAAGEELTLIAKLDSAGFDEATAETLALELPAGVTATTATSSQGTCTTAGNVTCTIGTLARNSGVTVVVTVRASGQAFAVTARRGGPVPDQNPADDAATVQIAGLGGTSGAGGSNGAAGAGQGAGAAQADGAAPVLSGVGLVRKPQASVKKGATLSLTLSEAATVQLKIERLVAGRRSGKACKAKGTGKRCQRAVLVATVSRPLPAGKHAMALTRKQLKAGTLRVTVIATDAAGNASAPTTVQGKLR